jgi:hypothetical protein
MLGTGRAQIRGPVDPVDELEPPHVLVKTARALDVRDAELDAP